MKTFTSKIAAAMLFPVLLVPAMLLAGAGDPPRHRLRRAGSGRSTATRHNARSWRPIRPVFRLG